MGQPALDDLLIVIFFSGGSQVCQADNLTVTMVMGFSTFKTLALGS